MQDIRYGFRMLLKNRSFSVLAVLALALGIGANSAIFSVVNALVLKPLPFEHLDRLVAVRSSLPNQGLKATGVSPADFGDWRAQNTVFKQIAAYRVRDITITGSGDPELVRGSFVSADFFSALELKALTGRTLLPDEDQPGRDQVAVLGHGLWQRRFGGDQNILGSTITLNDRVVTVVGIMPRDFDFPFGTDLWLPLALTPQQMRRDTRNLQVLAHLKSGVSVEQAQAEMLAVATRIEQQYPQTNTGLGVQVIALRDKESDFTKPLLSVLTGMAMFLLLIACANVANLLFARATVRQKEIAIRLALGASRRRVIRQLMTESFLLSGLAGIFGLMLSIWSVELIKASLPPDISRFMTGWKEIAVDGRVLLFTLAISFLTTLVFSLAPALQSSRPDLNETLKDGGRSSGANSGGSRARRFLVVSEISLALVLLVGAGLMVKGFSRILGAFQGADPERILTLQTPLPESRYKDPQKVAAFYEQVIARVRNLPGVESVSMSSNTPLNNRPNPSGELIIEGRPPLELGERQPADLVVVSSNYFATIGARMLSGRDFSESDGWESSPVAIISEAAASRYWPGEDPLGKRISGVASDQRWLTIVGIVSDVKQAWFDREIRPQLYLPYLQSPRPTMSFLLRVADDPISYISSIRTQIFAIDRDQPIEDIKTLSQLFVDETSPFRFAAVLISVFGGIALVLSAVGVYGVISYSVAQRTHEIGVRIALGASRNDVLRLVVGQGLKTAVLGLAVGFPLALALSRIMVNQLFGVVSLEYGVTIGLMLLLGAVSLLSSYVPALRATKVDPIVALHQD
ncbi:MAG TPA: ABC transporter permease [Blastocatellia bacterium]|nr:ABC transporter permease [Blastocatellia bacterium]